MSPRRPLEELVYDRGELREVLGLEAGGDAARGELVLALAARGELVLALRVSSRGGARVLFALLGLLDAGFDGGFGAEGLAVEVVAVSGARVERAGGRVRELPIQFVERVSGRSKMGPGIVAEALWRVTVWGVATRLGRSPLADA